MLNRQIRVDYFKRHQRDGIYHYIKVVGGPGKTWDGYQEEINFLNEVPIIQLIQNYVCDPSGLTGTWCSFEVGEPISKAEYQQAYEMATSGEFAVI